MIRRPYVKSALIAAAIGTQFLSIGSSAHAQSYRSETPAAPAANPVAAPQKADPENAVRPEIGVLLQAAQDLSQANKFAEAHAKIDQAEAVPNKTPYEAYLIDRVRGPIAAAAGEDAIAAKSLEISLAYDRITSIEKQRLMPVLASVYFRMKNYPNAIKWSTAYFKEGGQDDNVRTILSRSYYLTNDFKQAADELRTQMQVAEKAGKAPQEDQLRMFAASLLKAGDREGYGLALEKLVAHYPKEDSWASLLSSLFSKSTFSDRLTLDGYRLKLALGQMEDAKEYLDMSELAMRAGFPAEAKNVLEAGYKAGMLGTGADAAKHKRLRDAAAKSAADDQKTMAQGEAAANKKADGTGLVNLGYAFVTNGQFDKGLELMEKGIAKGGLKQPEEAKLHLALAYAQAGKKAEAIEKLKTVQGAGGTAELARYWTLHLNQSK
ncbi:MAG TPA: tetratricopeptide repeat protein [Paucimonas sp.]|nr:tetratricopeptide repeat protein [Paucimonas sp.]